RRSMAAGATAERAAEDSVREAGHTVFFSGAAVAIGFAALCLVRLPFLKALAFGGIAVIATSVLATLTLLPALMALLGARVNWPRRPGTAMAADSKIWSRWAEAVMRRPVAFLLAALALLALFIAPVARIRSWNMGASALQGALESRLGFEALDADFPAGWMGPVAMVLEAKAGASVLDDGARDAIA